MKLKITPKREWPFLGSCLLNILVSFYGIYYQVHHLIAVSILLVIAIHFALFCLFLRDSFTTYGVMGVSGILVFMRTAGVILSLITDYYGFVGMTDTAPYTLFAFVCGLFAVILTGGVIISTAIINSKGKLLRKDEKDVVMGVHKTISNDRTFGIYKPNYR